MNKDRELWGIDLGGTKVEGVVINPQQSTEPLCRIRVDTQASNGYEHILCQVTHLFELMQGELGRSPDVIGVGHPGVVDPATALLKNSNTVCMNGKPLNKDLSKALGVEVKTANDANCFALAEALLGAGKGKETVFGVIMGTGVGGGVVVQGKALYGKQGIGGEWGHTYISDEGNRCYCGKTGCIETFISGPALQSYYKDLTGKDRNLADIVHRAEVNKEKEAIATLDRLIKFFGKAISQIINILDPHIIVLGGGVSNVSALYTRGIEEAKKHVFNSAPQIEIVRHKLGDSAGVFGAAMLAA